MQIWRTQREIWEVFWIFSLKSGYIWKYPDIEKHVTKFHRDIHGYCLSGQNVFYNPAFYNLGGNHEFWVTGY